MYPTEKMPFYGIFVKEQVDSLREQGVAIDVLFINGKESRLNYITSIFALSKKIRTMTYDVIHLHHTYCVFLLVIAEMFCKRKNLNVLTFHEGEVHKTQGLNIGNMDVIKRLVFSKTIKWIAIKMVNMLITVQEDLINVLNFKGKYVVIPCGVDMNLFRPLDKKWCRSKLNLSLNDKIIFFPASPGNTNKGIDVLNEAIVCLNRKDVRLITAGHISHDDMPIYMSAADVVAQISDFEASPMVLKEAMAVNVPVVFSEVGDAQLIIRNTKGCFVCKRNKKDVVLKLKDALLCNGNAEGRKRIMEVGLGLSDVAKKIINVYRDLLQEN
jgi:glycosyltransferase involved in cell wall biosynthesis